MTMLAVRFCGPYHSKIRIIHRLMLVVGTGPGFVSVVFEAAVLAASVSEFIARLRCY